MTTPDLSSSCSRCGAVQPTGARFCPRCGSRAGSDETLELPVFRETDLSPASLHRVHRRPFGAHPVPFLAGAAGALLLLAVFMFALTSWVVGIIILAFWLAAVLLFLAAVRHDPDAPLARPALAADTRARATARFVRVAVRVWFRAAVELLGLTTRRVRLQRELGQRLGPLGEAVHRGDKTQAERIRTEAERLEREVRDTELAASAVVENARTELGLEREASGATQVIPTVADGTTQDDGEARKWASSRSSSSS